MAPYGFGLAAGALSNALADLQQKRLDVVQATPGIEAQALQQQAAQEQLAATRAARPFESFKRQHEMGQMVAELPYQDMLLQAKVAAALAGPAKVAAQTRQALADAAHKEAQAVTETRPKIIPLRSNSGYVEQSPTGETSVTPGTPKPPTPQEQRTTQTMEREAEQAERRQAANQRAVEIMRETKKALSPTEYVNLQIAHGVDVKPSDMTSAYHGDLSLEMREEIAKLQRQLRQSEDLTREGNLVDRRREKLATINSQARSELNQLFPIGIRPIPGNTDTERKAIQEYYLDNIKRRIAADAGIEVPGTPVPEPTHITAYRRSIGMKDYEYLQKKAEQGAKAQAEQAVKQFNQAIKGKPGVDIVPPILTAPPAKGSSVSELPGPVRTRVANEVARLNLELPTKQIPRSEIALRLTRAGLPPDMVEREINLLIKEHGAVPLRVD
jgi:hypothetical protein